MSKPLNIRTEDDTEGEPKAHPINIELHELRKRTIAKMQNLW